MLIPDLLGEAQPEIIQRRVERIKKTAIDVRPDQFDAGRIAIEVKVVKLLRQRVVDIVDGCGYRQAVDPDSLIAPTRIDAIRLTRSDRFAVREGGKTVGSGVVTKVTD